MARRLVHWLPALLYMGLLFMLSSQSNLPAPYEFPESDKVFHLLAYAPLGFLMVYALSRSTLRFEPWPWPGALAQDSAPRAYGKVSRACPWGSTLSAKLIFFGAFLAFLYGLTDEIHQAFVPGRDASALDAMADGTGAMIGSFLYTKLRFGKDMRGRISEVT